MKNNKRKIVLITGSMGLIGFENTMLYLKKGFCVIGVDNNLRKQLFHINTDYEEKLNQLHKEYGCQYLHFKYDIRSKKNIKELFIKYGKKIDVIIHTAAQTSHDWAQKKPITDWTINVTSTLNLLEQYRKYAHNAVFIFTSTNKVYGDLVNNFQYEESLLRYDLNNKDKYYYGINEELSIDQSKHSLFGVSKTSADLLVQEYGRYFDLKTSVFRLGVVSGAGQNGALEQGYLSYLLQKIYRNERFSIIGYKGKQVRDIIYAKDVAQAFYLYSKDPHSGEVYNLGGGRKNSASILELIKIIYTLTKKKLTYYYITQPRRGDHKWWITDYSKFKKQYPTWKITYSISDIILDIYQSLK